jgi:hypothetical protein
LKAIARSGFRVYDGTYTFEEFPLEQLPFAFNQQALAIVRDDMIWSQLVPSTDQSKDLFKIFSFHFDNCPDNSEFVGWLATYLKKNL